MLLHEAASLDTVRSMLPKLKKVYAASLVKVPPAESLEKVFSLDPVRMNTPS